MRPTAVAMSLRGDTVGLYREIESALPRAGTHICNDFKRPSIWQQAAEQHMDHGIESSQGAARAPSVFGGLLPAPLQPLAASSARTLRPLRPMQVLCASDDLAVRATE